MFVPKYNNAYRDFVDNDGLTEYYDSHMKYVPRPSNIDDTFTLYYKTFYKSGSNYYLGIQNESFVRSIHASDYKRDKEVFIQKEIAFRDFFQLRVDAVNNKNYAQGLLPHLD